MSRDFFLKRISHISSGTFGVLIDNDIPFCLTLERPWENNIRHISCIPGGVYNCSRVTSHKFGETFKVMSVQDRSHILFHKGNILSDTHGCIILGEEFGYLKGNEAVLSSGRAFNEFMNRLKNINEFSLKIIEVYTNRDHYNKGNRENSFSSLP